MGRFRGVEGENCENPECDREGVVETVEHLILYCPKYRAERSVLLNQLATLGIPLTIKVILLCDHEYRDYFPFILKCFLAYLNSIPRTQSYFWFSYVSFCFSLSVCICSIVYILCIYVCILFWVSDSVLLYGCYPFVLCNVDSLTMCFSTISFDRGK